MKKIKTLNIYMVLLVFFIMGVASFLSGLTLFILFRLRIISHARLTPLILSSIALLVSIFLGTCITLFISRKILKPINELIYATKIVAKGDFSVRVPETGEKNLLSDLLKSFNKMIDELSGIELFRQNFINNFSHEFKTPIVSIRGFAKQLTLDSITDEQRKEYAAIIFNEAQRLTNISSNILLLTKFEHQQIVNNQQYFDLDEQIRNCIILLEPEWSRKQIQFSIELAPVSYYSNEEMLSHVWMNLLSNSIKFCKEKVIVRCYQREDYVFVEITDDGMGIHKHNIGRIFEKFYQTDSSHGSEGNGLGLPLVKRIIELCNGEIMVTSELKKGTSFVIQLPVKITS